MSNGKLDDSELTIVHSDFWNGARVNILLSNVTADAYFEMLAACKRETGNSFYPAIPSGGYRSIATQSAMRKDWFNKIFWRYNMDANSTIAPAMPGSSNHGLGICVDIWGKGYQWCIVNGHRFGFSRPFGNSDPHHFQHDGSKSISPLDLNSIPLITIKDKEMKNSGIYYDDGNNTIIYVVFNYATGTYHTYSNGAGNGAMPSSYNNAIAEAFGTGAFAKVTKAHANVIINSLKERNK